MKNQVLTILLFFASVIAVSGAETERIWLSGTGSDDMRTWDFRCSSGQRSGRWSRIEVPSCWEQQGFGAYTYGRFYTDKSLRPSDEKGLYRTRFTIPASQAGRKFRLVFEGVMTDARVSIDGKQVGPVHQGGFTEFSYDITPFVRPGKKQTLEVEVSKESANASVNEAERRADWWLFGGIYRPVYIESLPEKHIARVDMDARADGLLRAKVFADGVTGEEPISLTVDGKKGEDFTSRYSADDSCFVVEARFPGISLWDPEHPNLHDAVFTLGGDEGHSVSRRTGFRTIDFRPHDGIYLNGKKLVVKGTNRHCFHPESGRTGSRSLSISDAKLLKYMNMNAVRCHYPSDSHFLDACDSLGLLYLDELPGWQTRYDDSTSMRVTREMVVRDMNHPCVFIWSNGNEGGWNPVADPLFAELDIQNRKVIHPWADYDGIDTHHYPAYQTGAYRMHHGQNVFMPTEFLHGQYDKGQGAALRDFWENWTRSPLFAGGFIWAFVDEAVRRTDMPTGKSAGLHFGQKGFDITDCVLDSDGPNGPDGCTDPYRQPEASVDAIREVWSPIYIDRLDVTPGFDGRIAVENRWLFTDFSECRMKYSLKRCGTTADSVTRSGEVTLPEAAPGERGFATFTLPDGFFDNDILELTAYGPDGVEVCTWNTLINRHAPWPATAAGLTADEVRVEFTDNGLISRITRGGTVIPLTDGPLPVGMLAECYERKTRKEADGTEVNVFRYRGGIDSIEWRQTPDGRLHMDALLLNSPHGHRYPGNFITKEGGWQIGLTFSYPDSIVSGVRWTGKGPYRVWRNREQGVRYGVWEKDYNNTVTGQYGTSEPPVYPEFKGYHADVRNMTILSRDSLGFSVSSGTEDLYVRLFTPEEPGARGVGEMLGGMEKKSSAAKKPASTMVKFPEGDLSFLLSIPPMRSYKPLEQQGPQSQPDVIRIKPGDDGFRIRLTFDFSN